jgi:NitT/TauT family transport system permease protein
MRGERWQDVRVGQVAVVCGVVAGWQLLAMKAGSTFLPGPGEALATLVDGVRRGWMVPHLVITLIGVLGGYACAVVVGLAIGFLLGASPALYGAYEGPLLSLYAVPKVTLFPLFLAAFGLGIESKIAFGAFHGLFPVAIYTWTAMRTMKLVHLKVARSLGLSRLETLRWVVWPAVVPGIVTGLRLGFNVTFLGVVLGEMFASRSGMGFLLMSFGGAFDASRIVAVIVAVFVIGVGCNWLLIGVERKVRGVRGLELAVS